MPTHSPQPLPEQMQAEKQLKEQLAMLQAANAQLEAQLHALQQDQLQALAVQTSLLPENNSNLEGWQLNYHLEAALNLSGDFLDFFSPRPNQVYFYLADVAGSGSASAYLALLVKYLIKKQTFKHPGLSPAQLCSKLNQELLSLKLEKHLTLACGLLNLTAGELTFCLAAHLPQALLVKTANQKVLAINEQNPPLGLFPTAEYKDYTCPINDISAICLASDGVLEVMQGKGLTAKHTAWQQLVAAKKGKLTALVAALEKPVSGWPDDLTLMTLSPLIKRWNGKKACKKLGCYRPK